MSKTYTRGDVIVEEINIGDIHYEYEYNIGFKCEVMSKPYLNEEGAWVWKSKNLKSDKEINYIVHPQYAHYGPKLYTYEAYTVNLYV